MNILSALIRVYKTLLNQSIDVKGILHIDTIKLSQRLDVHIEGKQIFYVKEF